MTAIVTQLKRGSQVRMADGREGVVKSITKAGTIEIRCYGGGVCFSHVDCVTVL